MNIPGVHSCVLNWELSAAFTTDDYFIAHQDSA